MVGTLRGRLAAIAFAAMFLVLAVGGFLFLGLLQRSLESEVDQSIINRAFDISVEIDITDQLDNAGFPNDPETFVGIIEDPLGEPVLDFHNDLEPDVAALLEAFDSVGNEFDVPVDASIPSITLTEGADNLRIVFTPVVSGDEIVAVARTLDGIERTVSNVRSTTLLAVPLLALLVAALVYVLAGRALKPVEEIRAEVDSITGGDLSRRILVPGSKDVAGSSAQATEAQRNEIARLAATMNDMLARLESSQVAQQRFTSDAAHELRTPLASMRAQLEVDLAHPETADWRGTVTHLQGEVERMQRLIEDLLQLARSDGDGPRALVAPKLVDLDDVALAEVSLLVRRPGVEVDASMVSAASVRGNADDLRRLAANLLTNAMRHAETRVGVSVTETSGQSVMVVEDDGAGIGEADREAIFERFVRLDEARSRDGGGSGLGLALSREIAVAHGGRLDVGVSNSGGARFVLQLPVAGAADQT